MRTALSVAGLVTISILNGRSAAAERFVEVFGGRAEPLAAKAYTRRFGDTYKVGGRFGYGRGRAWFELGIDGSPMDDTFQLGATRRSRRMRVLAGGRVTAPVGTAVDLLGRAMTAHVFFRLAAGADVVDEDVEERILGLVFENHYTDVGLALELGGGLAFDLGQVSLGAQVAFPLAVHFREHDGVEADPLLDYAGVDLDLTFVAAIRF